MEFWGLFIVGKACADIMALTKDLFLGQKKTKDLFPNINTN